ncbi:MAG: amidohydrolase family protein [Candidatus Puniceispirillaceae bacterium]
MTRIDAHHHLWKLDAVSYPWLEAQGVDRFFGNPTPIQRDFLLDELRSLGGPHNVTGSVHIQVGAADNFAEASYIDGVANASPDWHMVQVAAADLEAEDALLQIERLKGLSSVRGVRQIIGRAPKEDAASGTHNLLRNPAFKEGLAALSQHQLSFDLQLIPDVMEEAGQLFASLPELPVVLCHGGSPYDRSAAGLAQWADALKHLSALDHIYVKFSGLGMFEHDWTPDSLRPILSELWNQFGAERIMFGSNFPVCSLSSSYADLVALYEAFMPASAQDDFFGKTARAFYRF